MVQVSVSARTDIATMMMGAGFKHRFLMARATRLPVVGQAMEFALFEKDRMIYLPKDSAVESARTTIFDIGKEVDPINVLLPSQVIDRFLHRSKYIFIMDRCMCRSSNDCQRYPPDLGCIFLGAGVLRIPPHMGHMATAEEAIEHMRKGREMGLVQLIGRNKIDSVWLNTGPKEDLLSICNCCECCCLWKMLPNLSSSIAGGVTRMPGVTVSVTDDCTGCGSCIDDGVCFVKALTLQDGRAVIDQDMCKGCGRCVEHCPQHAVTMMIDGADYVDRSVRAIEPLVDIERE